MGVGFQVIGAEDLEKKLQGLGAKVAGKVVRPALRAGAKVVQAAAKSSAVSVVGGKMGGQIAKAIKVRANVQGPGRKRKRRRGEYTISVAIIPQTGKDELVYLTKGSASSLETHRLVGGYRYFIPSAIEYGHAFPGRGGKGVSGAKPPKDVAARPFMRPAFDTAGRGAIKISAEQMRRGIEAAAQE